MLTAAELTAMQATQIQTMTDVIVIARRTLTSDSMGGYTEAWANVLTTVGRVAPMSQKETVTAGQQGITANWKITLPASTDVRGADRLTQGARSFEVNGILGAETRETARVCLCQAR